MKRLLAVVAVVAVVAGLAPFAAGAQTAPAASAYDGVWHVSIDCPNARDGALGYNYDLETRIENGMLKGERLHEGEAGWLRVEGRVRPDGRLSLSARGLTGDAKFSVGHVAKRTPFSYRAHGRLEAARGQARRDDDTRTCDLTFVRR